MVDAMLIHCDFCGTSGNLAEVKIKWSDEPGEFHFVQWHEKGTVKDRCRSCQIESENEYYREKYSE